MSTSLKDTYHSMGDTYQQDKDSLITQSHLAQIKPFTSLKRFTTRNSSKTIRPTFTPASGQAIITYIVSGEAAYSDSTGKHGILKKDGWAWVISGAGIWYSLEPITSDYVAIQLCIALSPALENSPPQSAYLNPDLPTRDKSPQDDPAQVLIGWNGKNRSKFAVPSLLNYLVVHLDAHQTWSYEFPLNHQFAWVAVISGRLESAKGEMRPNSLTIFRRPTEKIECRALTDSIVVLGSSADFDHDLIFQHHSVHTSAEALQLGLKGISEAEKKLRE